MDIIKRIKGKFVLLVANHMPRSITYWSGIRLLAEATSRISDRPVPQILMIDALKQWDKESVPDADVSRWRFFLKKGKKDASKNLEKKR
jgi:hypothetical protein